MGYNGNIPDFTHNDDDMICDNCRHVAPEAHFTDGCEVCGHFGYRPVKMK